MVKTILHPYRAVSIKKTLTMNRIFRTAVWMVLISAGFFPLLNAQSTRQVSSFEGVSLSGGITVYLEPGDKESVSIDSEGIPEEEITVKVSQGELRVQLLKSLWSKDKSAKIYITYKSVTNIKASAGAKVYHKGLFQSDKLELKAHSGAIVEMDLKTDAVKCSASEGGRLELNGETNRLYASAATGGQCDADGLDSQTTYVKVNTGGYVSVVAKQSLEISANTGGQVDYRGDPKEINTSTFASGKIRRVDGGR